MTISSYQYTYNGVTVTTNLPSTITAGDDVSFTLTASGVAQVSPAWRCKIVFAQSGNIQTVQATTVSDLNYEFTVGNAVTSLLEAGNCSYQIILVSGANSDDLRKTIGVGGVNVLPSLLDNGGEVDTRSTAQIVVSAFDTFFRGEADNTVRGIIQQSCGDLNVSFATPQMLQDWYNFWTNRLRQEQSAQDALNGRSSNRTVYGMFIK